MGDSMSVRVLVLWSDELRAARRALDAVRDIPHDDPRLRGMVVAALNACHAALLGIDDGPMTVCEASAGRFVPREIKVEKPRKDAPPPPAAGTGEFTGM
jgi:hypothetical protein